MPEPEDPFPSFIAGMDQYGEMLSLLAGVLGKYNHELEEAGIPEDIRDSLLSGVQWKFLNGPTTDS